MKILVIGYGRAGQRHASMLQQIGYEIGTADPYAAADWSDWLVAINACSWDGVVIASPPRHHLAQLWSCVAHNLPTLCEKPLCGLGQYEAACELPRDARIMVAYNWLYNQSVLDYKVDVMQRPPGSFGFFAEQARVIPEWGLLLDHVSHDISILDHVSGGITGVSGAHYFEDYNVKAWQVRGKTAGGDFTLTERVYTPEEPVVRTSRINDVDLVPEQEMFWNLLNAFLKGNYYPNLQDALRYQYWLEEIGRWQGIPERK